MDYTAQLSELQGQRTIATVVFTDCVGFSLRMSLNEEHTLKLIRRDLKLMRQVCEESEGRVLKTTGDGLLMYFISAVKAVECAVAIQTRLLKDEGATRSPEDVLRHRIGIHLADMFITETDVMGNGVNIAARLQAEADPGGICISQTVFDEVKASLNLETHFLGPRELKHIREVVPVYKICLTPPVETDIAVGRLIESLQHHELADRIKKLLTYVCRNQWLSDPEQLNTIPLPGLVAELQQLAPTPDRLQSTLYRFVQTLSKPDAYTEVANVVVKSLLPLYITQRSKPSGSDTQPLANPVELVLDTSPQRYHVAAMLVQEAEITRIKKLMLYVCRRQWESDPACLEGIDLIPLVRELQQMAATLPQLKTQLLNVVETLNKPREYQAIAQTVIHHMSGLYSAPPIPAPQPVEERVDTCPAISPFVTLPPEPLTAENQAVDIDLVETGQSLDLFDYRWGIMKYANPLQAKLLLFSALHHPFEDTEQDWLMLRSLDLETLLRDILQRCPSYTDLELMLYETARASSTPEPTSQIATTIIKCLRPHYIYGVSAPIAEPPPKDPVSMDLSPPPPPAPVQEDDFTCQLFPSSPNLQQFELPGSKSTKPISGQHPTPEGHSARPNSSPHHEA